MMLQKYHFAVPLEIGTFNLTADREPELFPNRCNNTLSPNAIDKDVLADWQNVKIRYR